MKNNINIFFVLLTAITLVACKSPKEGTVNSGKPSEKPKFAIDFMPSETLGAVLDQAKAEGKLVFVDFYTDWCAPCKMMDEDVFTDKELASYYNKHFISYKVDAEKGNGVNLATIFEVKYFPTLIYLDHRGRVLTRKNSAAYHTEMYRLADEAIEIYAENN